MFLFDKVRPWRGEDNLGGVGWGGVLGRGTGVLLSQLGGLVRGPGSVLNDTRFGPDI